MEISKVKVGERFRKDLGDLKSLADSIREIGLLHPVVVDEQGNLIAGLRRLRACESLGWKQVPVTVVSLRDLARGEVEENRERKDFTITEIKSIDNYYEPILTEEAKERMLAGKPSSESDEGRTDEKIAKLCGIGRDTLHRIRAIVEAAEVNPEKFDKLLKKVDKGDTSIAYAYQSVTLQQKHENPPPLPEGKYDVLYADPPWGYYYTAVSGNAEVQYQTMSLEDICSLEVPSAKDAVLFLWATNPLLREALKVMESWGFEYLTNIVWVKNGLGIGYYVRGDHELLLIGKKGNIPPPEEENRPSSVIKADKQGHSVKPTEAYDIIEAMYPHRKRLELFARKTREGWASWGLEAGKQA